MSVVEHRGTVTAFDVHVGWGEVTAVDGRVLGFHCIGIADGSRSIALGTEVRFELLAKLGRFEATALRPV